jgi:hypothetical protein
MEACVGAHQLSRRLKALGHHPRQLCRHVHHYEGRASCSGSAQQGGCALPLL